MVTEKKTSNKALGYSQTTLKAVCKAFSKDLRKVLPFHKSLENALHTAFKVV